MTYQIEIFNMNNTLKIEITECTIEYATKLAKSWREEEGLAIITHEDKSQTVIG